MSDRTVIRVQAMDGHHYDLICSNCDGRTCMSCVFREWHDDCRDDCYCCRDGGPEVTYRMIRVVNCEMCGEPLDDGFASVNGKRYCHGGDDPLGPTCYEIAQRGLVR